MRRFIHLTAAVLFVATIAQAKNMYVPISAVAGGANNTVFRTDLRIFNPSDSDTLAVTIHFLPANQDGTNISGRVVEIPARQMAVIDNVVSFLGFPTPSVGALRLDSDNTGDSGPDFLATSRTYTDSPNPAAPGTFGQFIPAREETDAKLRVAVLQLSNSVNLSTGFRTNAGAMNPGQTAAVVTPSLFAANGTLIKKGADFTVPAKSVVQQGVVAMFGLDAATGTFANGYIIFESTEPIFGYASVVDNRSSDQIFVLGAEDSGSFAATPEPTEETVTINGLMFEPARLTIRPGDTVRWEFDGATHTTTSDARTGPEVWDSGNLSSGSFSHTFQTVGEHRYYCRIHGAPGGSGMSGVITVQP